MVERPRRGKKKHKLLGNHQRSWLWGRHLVTELISNNRWPIQELYLADDIPPETRISLQQQATQSQTPCHIVTRERLAELCHTSEHQGFLARVGPYPYATGEALLENLSPSFLGLVLVGIQDPHNLGAILRSAEVLGVNALFLGEQGQTGINSQVARSSAGAVNRLSIARVPDVAPLLEQLKSSNVRTFATSLQSARPLYDCDLGGPIAFVMGNEGTGLPPELVSLCTERVIIPQAGGLDSLNVAAAAAVCLYEARRQRLSPLKRS